MSRRLLTLVLLAAAVTPARAQRYGEPSTWLSAGIGLWQSQGVYDPATNAAWNFGSATQYRGAIEFPVGNGVALGVTGTYASVPLTYQGSLFTTDATMAMSQVLGTVHVGGGMGFHQVIDLSAGAVSFAGLKASDGTSLQPDKSIIDFTFALGYGLGYGLSRSTELTLVQEYSTFVHARGSGNAGGNNTPRQWVTRFGVRYGVGGQ